MTSPYCLFVSQAYLWTVISSSAISMYGMSVPLFRFPIYQVESCPRNLSGVIEATERINCSGVEKFRNVYHCLPLSDLSELVEFCYDGISGLVEDGNCMVLENRHLNNRPCRHFTEGCPVKPFFPKTMFSYAACLVINKRKKCYVADPSCPSVDSSYQQTTNFTNNMTSDGKTGWLNEPRNSEMGYVTPLITVLCVVIVAIVCTVVVLKQCWRLHRKENETLSTSKGCKDEPVMNIHVEDRVVHSFNTSVLNIEEFNTSLDRTTPVKGDLEKDEVQSLLDLPHLGQPDVCDEKGGKENKDHEEHYTVGGILKKLNLT